MIFEGEFLYNWRIKGKEYNLSGTLIYEGEYSLNQKYNGKGFDKNGNIIYEIVNGKGNYKEFFENGNLKYDITYLNNSREATGKEYNVRGKLIFEGEFLYLKKWNGKGYDTNNNIIYELKDGKGFVQEFNENGRIEYECEYLNGERNGRGKKYINGVLMYEGEFLNGKICGKGREFNFNDKVASRIGRVLYEGGFINGIRSGKGKEYKEDGELIFEGEILNEKRWNGKGKEYEEYENPENDEENEDNLD